MLYRVKHLPVNSESLYFVEHGRYATRTSSGVVRDAGKKNGGHRADRFYMPEISNDYV